jgi:hypothetical protein
MKGKDQKKHLLIPGYRIKKDGIKPDESFEIFPGLEVKNLSTLSKDLVSFDFSFTNHGAVIKTSGNPLISIDYKKTGIFPISSITTKDVSYVMVRIKNFIGAFDYFPGKQHEDFDNILYQTSNSSFVFTDSDKITPIIESEGCLFLNISSDIYLDELCMSPEGIDRLKDIWTFIKNNDIKEKFLSCTNMQEQDFEMVLKAKSIML